MRIHRILVCLCLVAAVAFATRFQGWARDFGQCARRCAGVYGPEVDGRRAALFSSRCRCARDGREIGRIERRNPVEEVPLGPGICGADGIDYPDAAAAERVTTVLHGGFCGKCSNEQDIGVYRRTREQLTKISTQCATRYLLFGRKAADRCLDQVAFTPACEQCWLDNMACTIVHCRNICLKTKLLRTPNSVDGKLNACLACDEAHCGAPFIRCAGVNRRRAGIRSDIERPEEQIYRGR